MKTPCTLVIGTYRDMLCVPLVRLRTEEESRSRRASVRTLQFPWSPVHWEDTSIIVDEEGKEGGHTVSDT